MDYSGYKVGREIVRRYREGERDFRERDLSGAKLSGADLSETDLSGADLSGANLRHTTLSGVDLSGVDLSRAEISGARLSSANLSGSNLREADLSGADLRHATLSGVDLSRADLSETDLSGADLSGANLRHTTLSGVDLSGVDLSEADLGDADLEGATVTKEQLEKARNFAGATMPDGSLCLRRRKRPSADGNQTGVSGAIPSNVRQAVLDRDDYICRYCGHRSQTVEVDHVVPVSQGGTSTLNNLVAACRDCNRRKAGRRPEEAGMQVLPVRTLKRS